MNKLSEDDKQNKSISRQLSYIFISVFFATFLVGISMAFENGNSIQALLGGVFIIAPFFGLSGIIFAVPLIFLVALPYNMYLWRRDIKNWALWLIPAPIVTIIYIFVLLPSLNSEFEFSSYFPLSNKSYGILFYCLFLGLISATTCRVLTFREKASEEIKVSKNAVAFFIMACIMLALCISLIIASLKM